MAATNMNKTSSRSHSVFIFSLTQKNAATGTVKTSKLTLVDLAGSEKTRKTGASGQTMVEAQHIHKSLSALGNVINALTTTAASHVPYRDSKLTRLLSDSLGGNSKTVMESTNATPPPPPPPSPLLSLRTSNPQARVATAHLLPSTAVQVLIITCSPAATELEETLSTCRFGNRAKSIKNKPKINQEMTSGEYVPATHTNNCSSY